MRCPKCNHEMDPAGGCAYCEGAKEEDVRVLTPEERAGYDGLTIDPDGREEDHAGQSRRSWQGEQARPRIYVKKIGGGSSKWLTKLLIFAAVAAIISFLVFIILPTALIAVGIGIVVWMLLSFLRG